MVNTVNLSDFLKQYSHKGNYVEAFDSFAKQSSGDKRDLDLLISIQREYRKIVQCYLWEQRFRPAVEAGGYLGHKYNNIVDYMYEIIVAQVIDENDPLYFLPFCLTVAAKSNIHATELLLKLKKYHWMWQLEYDGKELNEVDYIRLNQDVRVGLKDSRILFDTATPEVIEYLFSRVPENGANPHIIGMLNNIMGDNPNVKCLKIDEKGGYSSIYRDFSKDVISLIMNGIIIQEDVDFVYRWCNNDIVFTKMVMDAFENPEIRILYVISYLRGKIESVESQIKEYSTDPKMLLSVAAALEFDSQKYLEKLQKERQLYIHTLSDLENKDTKLRTLSTLQGLAYESVGADSGHIAHPFRSYPHTHSGVIRTLIPG